MYVSEKEILYYIGLIDVDIRYYEDYKDRLSTFIHSERNNLPKSKFAKILNEINETTIAIYYLRKKQDQYHQILINQHYGNKENPQY